MSVSLGGVLKFTIFVIGLVLIILGIYMLPLDHGKENTTTARSVTFDSTIKTSIQVDSLNHTKAQKTDIERNYKTQVPGTAGQNTDQARYDNAYKYILLGTLIIFLLFLLPFLSNFSILGIFSGTFRDKVDAMKNISNQAQQAAVLAPPALTPPVIQKEIPSEKMEAGQRFTENKAEITVYPDDPQKGKWGGKSSVNDRLLSATVTRYDKLSLFFKVILKVTSTDPNKPIKGSVKFHLHNTFLNPDPEIFVVGGRALLELKAWGAFTVGAEADGGMTRLELDLSELPDAPEIFKKR